MKRWYQLIGILAMSLPLIAQDQVIVPTITERLTAYKSARPAEKIFVATDKTNYRPGETVWFRAFVTDEHLATVSEESNKLFVKLYDSNGAVRIESLFNLNKGVASCDIALPKDLGKGVCFLCAYTSASAYPNEISVTKLVIDPAYANQWISETKLKESISTGGVKNELYLTLKEFSGSIQKNTVVRYQIVNGQEVVQKGKLKTDGTGKLTIPFTLPSSTNGGPFLFQLSDNREEWGDELFLQTNLDSVFVDFYPEGGSRVPGAISKIGFTAYNKWGIPVDIEGNLQNEEGQSIPVRTFTRGLGMFALETKAGQKYHLKITGKTGENQSFPLPETNQQEVALTVLKTDADFVTAAIHFRDTQKHQTALTVTKGGVVHWSAEPEIERSGSIRIPTKNLPQGINLLSLFTAKGQLLATRLLYVEKFQELNISVLPEKTVVKAGETLKIKVQLADKTGKPLAGNMSIAVTDQECLTFNQSKIFEEIQLASFLETPFNLISSAFKGRITQNTLLDVFLITNRLKNFSWDEILKYNPNKEPGVTTSGNLLLETRLTTYMEMYAKRENWMFREKSPDPEYLSANAMLFAKAPKLIKLNTIPIDNQRKMLESASGILDVVKTMKQFRIINNQIVFSGSENSINYQGGALIVLDGQMLGTDISNINSISPRDVDHINVSTNPMDIQKYTGLNSVGVIEIYTKRAVVPEKIEGTEIVEKYENGYRVPNIFPAAPANLKNDKRTTLLWIPSREADNSGLLEFSVTAGSVCSNFVITIQCISKDGRLGSGKAMFSVTR